VSELEPTGELGPMGDVYLLAASLRANRTDVASYAEVLSDALGATLPEGMVTVERKKSMADRVAGRPGQVVALVVATPDRQLELRQGHHGLSAQVRQVVRGVVLSRKDVSLDDWVRELAGQLSGLAERDARAAEALRQLLNPDA
jgi:hypothetical protein